MSKTQVKIYSNNLDFLLRVLSDVRSLYAPNVAQSDLKTSISQGYRVFLIRYLEAQEKGILSPLNEINALHQEVNEINHFIRYGKFTPELLMMIKKAKSSDLRFRREGKL